MGMRKVVVLYAVEVFRLCFTKVLVRVCWESRERILACYIVFLVGESDFVKKCSLPVRSYWSYRSHTLDRKFDIFNFRHFVVFIEMFFFSFDLSSPPPPLSLPKKDIFMEKRSYKNENSIIVTSNKSYTF